MSETYRFQLSRARGYRMPAGGIVCRRPTKWGNEWRIEWLGELKCWQVTRWNRISGHHYVCSPLKDGVDRFADRQDAVAFAVVRHREALLRGELQVSKAAVLRELMGHPLGCTCKLEDACHVENYVAVCRGEL